MRKEGSSALEKLVQDIRRKIRRPFSAEEKIRIVLEGLRGEDSIATPCRKEGLAATPHGLYHRTTFVCTATASLDNWSRSVPLPIVPRNGDGRSVRLPQRGPDQFPWIDVDVHRAGSGG